MSLSQRVKEKGRDVSDKQSVGKGVFRWEEPPSRKKGQLPRHRGRLGLFNPEEVAEKLKRRPGTSACIVESVSQSYAASSPLIKRLKELGVEVRATKIGTKDGKYAVYAKTSEKRGPGRPRKVVAA